MGTLILVRHGESIWNRQKRFTGWVDVSLSPAGMAQAEQAGDVLCDQHLDVVFTSALLRAQDTAYEILKRNRQCPQYVRVHEAPKRDWYERFVSLPATAWELKIYVSEMLNERYYGDLQGMLKDEAATRFGAEQVHQWRRSYDVPPPNGESLQMTEARVTPYYDARIAPSLRLGYTVLVCAHGNSLRALIKHIEHLTPEQIFAFELKTGTPVVYRFDADLKLCDKHIIDTQDDDAAGATANTAEDIDGP
ncbi:MAG: 2,3-bisphosphoglycerate-dependent phosphoglycerate mutase [Rhizomicrobium sp.]